MKNKIKTLKTLKDVNCQNKKIIVRAGLNVPVSEAGEILDDSRLQAAKRSLDYIFQSSPALVLVTAHWGRPKGRPVERLSLRNLVPSWEKILQRRIVFIDKLERLQAIKQAGVFDDQAVYLLENLRFWPNEEANDQEFARFIAQDFDLYVNDAFSVSHRSHSSITQFPCFTREAVAGLLFAEEYQHLSQVRDNPQQPAVAIIGGAKTATKLPVIKHLERKYAKILVAGKVANEILDQKIKFGEKVVLPVDFAPVEEEEKRLDIGPLTVAIFRKEIIAAQTIVWNGPVGKFEAEKTARGTKKIIEYLEDSAAFKVIGGGETLAAVKKFGDLSKYDYVSYGGGAMLEFLSGRELPGIAVLLS